ncbi:MAG TPA: DNA repair protein, partial [Lactobacillus sp.]|nr:DNA repair protein [Lactobacillus sp.]
LTDKSVLSELLEFLLDKQLADQVVERYFAQTDALAQLQYFGVTDLNKLTADAKLQYYLLLLC